MSSEPAIVHVIDDDEALRDSLTFLLRTADLEVMSHSSAAAFLDSLPLTGLTCIITDVRMPGLSGIDLLRRIRELGIEVPVIVITGHGDVPLAVEAMRFGAIDFLEKPFDDEILLQSVLGGLVAGRANKQIAFELGISPRTVEIYRANLMDKMQAGSLSDLVRMALIVGILGRE
jgi:two-component system response regulator FixJ